MTEKRVAMESVEPLLERDPSRLGQIDVVYAITSHLLGDALLDAVLIVRAQCAAVSGQPKVLTRRLPRGRVQQP